MASSILFQLHLPIPIPDLAILIPSNSGIGIEGNSNSNSGIGPTQGDRASANMVFDVMLFQICYITAFWHNISCQPLVWLVPLFKLGG